MPDSPQGASAPNQAVRLLAREIGVPIDPADFGMIAGMVQALWRSGGRIRLAFDNNVSVIPLTAVPDHIPGVSE